MTISHLHPGAMLAANAPDGFVLGALIGIAVLAAIGAIGGMFAAVRGRRTQQLLALALCDGLTGVGNRRRLDRDLIVGAADAETPVAVIMLDIDHFKLVNDKYGHEAGDEALREVAGVMCREVGVGDVVYRYGGEKFCVLLTRTTSSEAGEEAERIRSAISHLALPVGESLTVSIGVALGKGAHVAQTMSRADQALSKSKHDGRDRVTLAAQPLLGPMAVGQAS